MHRDVLHLDEKTYTVLTYIQTHNLDANERGKKNGCEGHGLLIRQLLLVVYLKTATTKSIS